MSSLEPRLKHHARSLGFDLVGIAPAEPADGFDHLRDWLAKGYAGDMDYMQRHGAARRHPESILPGVRSVVMVALNYQPHPDACAKQPSVWLWARAALNLRRTILLKVCSYLYSPLWVAFS